MKKTLALGTMALRSSSQRLPSLLRPRSFMGWGSALAVGLVAVKCNWRSMGTLGSGDFRSEFAIRCSTSLFRSRTLSSANLPFSWSSAISPMSLTPPQAPPSWKHPAEDITPLTKEFIANHRAVEDKVGALAPKDCNFQSASISTLLQHSPLIVMMYRSL
jgi:hypothetical protein